MLFLSFFSSLAIAVRPTYKVNDLLNRAAHPHGMTPDAADVSVTLV